MINGATVIETGREKIFLIKLHHLNTHASF